MQEYDMLVRLYALPEFPQPDERLTAAGIRIHRVMAADRTRVSRWILEHFSREWADEFEKAMCNTPVTGFIAVDPQKRILGFACCDATFRGFFGPVGVDEAYRGLHIGQELVRAAMYAMRETGYGYAIIGWVEEKNRAFYHRACGAVPIPDSFPGVYANSLFV